MQKSSANFVPPRTRGAPRSDVIGHRVAVRENTAVRVDIWDELERRVRTLHRSSFPPSSLVSSNSVSAMDPDVQDEVRQMLDGARRAGFQLRVVSTYRSSQQERSS